MNPKTGEPNSDLFVVSDHGFAPLHTTVSLNKYLANQGVDPNKLRAVTCGPAVNVCINLEGRESGGTVSRTEYVELMISWFHEPGIQKQPARRSSNHAIS